jgi:hypothetical protein
MNNPIERIVQFNKDAGLLEKGYNDFLESSFQIEEALEGFNFPCTMTAIMTPSEIEPTHKNFSRYIVSSAMEEHRFSLVDVDRLDKACDAVVFAVGSMAKLGLTADQIMRSLNIVMDANRMKLGMPKDEHGKLIKPADFVGPEVHLQKVLDER